MRHYYAIEYEPKEDTTKHVHRFDCATCRDSWVQKPGSHRYAIERRDLSRGQLMGFSDHYHGQPLSEMDWLPQDHNIPCERHANEA